MANKMTRQEELNEAWCNYRGKCSTEVLHALAYASSWCDEHPAWISVEDELPPYSKQVLVYSENDPWAEMWWSERYTEDGARFGKDGKYQILTDSNGFATLRDDDNEPIHVTHWMRIEPPEHFADVSKKISGSSEIPNNHTKTIEKGGEQ